MVRGWAKATSRSCVLVGLFMAACSGHGGCLLAEASSHLAIGDSRLPSPEFVHGTGWKAHQVQVTDAEGTLVWAIGTPRDGGVDGVNRVRYGVVAEGFLEGVRAKPLVPGTCYQIHTDAAPAGGETIFFRVAGPDAIARGCEGAPDAAR
jgi:hypothetical protein